MQHASPFVGQIHELCVQEEPESRAEQIQDPMLAAAAGGNGLVPPRRGRCDRCPVTWQGGQYLQQGSERPAR